MAFISVFPGFTAEPGFGLTGNIGDGNSVTITGSGFGTKPNGAKPWLIIELGKGIITIDPLSRATWTPGWNTNANIAQNVVAPNRTHSMEYEIDAGVGGAMNTTGFDLSSGTTKLKTYTFQRFRHNFDGLEADAAETNYNLKGLRYWFQVGKNNYFIDNWGQQNLVDGAPRQVVEKTDPPAAPGGQSRFYTSGGEREIFGLSKNVWRTREMELLQSSAADIEDATVKAICGGFPVTAGPDDSGDFTSRDTAFPNLYTLMFMHQDQNSGDMGFTGFAYYDLIFIEDSWCRVIISEEPTWEAATASPEVLYEREPQIITAYADDAVIIKMRRGVHASFADKYLYVTDEFAVTQKILQFN